MRHLMRLPAIVALFFLLPVGFLPVGVWAQNPLPSPSSQAYQGQSCVSCHLKVTPAVVRDYQSGVKWRFSRQSCETCHGNDHEKINEAKGRVPDELCAKCHAPIYREHTEGGHSYGTDAFIKGTNAERSDLSPHNAQFSPDVRKLTCDACHSIAGAGRITDTSSMKNKSGCGQCHTPHSFSLEEARRPEACTTCHTGPEDSSTAAYSASSHGAIFASAGQGWDWKASLKTARYRTPTCAYCHMRIVDDKGVVVTHNMSRKINWGMGLDLPSSSGQVNQTKRKEMLRICSECHTPRFSQEYLEGADKIRVNAALLVKEARKIIEGLYEDKIVTLSGRALSPGLAGTAHTFTVSEGFGLYWPMGLFYDTSRIEKAYFDLAVFHSLTAFKGAMHMSPSHTWWMGLIPAHEDLVDIRAEDHVLRTFAKVRRYALIGIGLGGIAVILFLFAPRQRRKRSGIEL